MDARIWLQPRFRQPRKHRSQFRNGERQAAVKNKQIPVLEIGRRKIVPRGPWLK
jgi:hypothetical protein